MFGSDFYFLINNLGVSQNRLLQNIVEFFFSGVSQNCSCFVFTQSLSLHKVLPTWYSVLIFKIRRAFLPSLIVILAPSALLGDAYNQFKQIYFPYSSLWHYQFIVPKARIPDSALSNYYKNEERLASMIDYELQFS